MKYIVLALSWLFGIFFGLLTVIAIAAGRFIPAIPLLIITLLLLPPVGTVVRKITARSLHWLIRGFLIIVLLVIFVILSFNTIANEPLYKSPEVQAKLMTIYDAKLAEWPVPYESEYVQTMYGKVHVVISGPDDAPPVLLLHAASLPSWSWMSIIKEMNEHYRTYAIDYIGEANRSVLNDPKIFPVDGRALSDLYVDISSKLGVAQSHVIAASVGGYVATNYALYAPERVEKLVLLGPMGVTPATASVALKLMVGTLFPIQPSKDAMYYWALGDNPVVHDACGEWFHTILDGAGRKGPPPLTFTPEQLQQIKVPVLLVLGTKDALVDDPEKVIPLAQNVPDIQIEILNTAHCIWIEQPDMVNALIQEFLGTNGARLHSPATSLPGEGEEKGEGVQPPSHQVTLSPCRGVF